MIRGPDLPQRTMEGSNVVVPVLERHADDVASIWELRHSAVKAPHINLNDLARLDGRVEANLDGLRVGGATGLNLALQGARGGGGGVFTASVLLLEAETPSLSQLIEPALVDPESTKAFVSALGWIPRARAGKYISKLLEGNSPLEVALGIAAASIHRMDLDGSFGRYLAAGDPQVRARAIRTIAEVGRLDLVPKLEPFSTGDIQDGASDGEVRFWAAWATVVLTGTPRALSVLASITHFDIRHHAHAVQTVMRRAEATAARVWLRRLAQEDATRRLAIQGTGALGDPAEIPWLIDQMRIAEFARVAGESFTTITGVDIAYQDLEGARPDGFESGPTEDPADEDVQMDPDENLPWPDPTLILKWWQLNKSSFQSGTRYLLGKPITIERCQQVLRIGRQRQRAAAALELAMRKPGTPLFEVRAPGFRQKQLLGI